MSNDKRTHNIFFHLHTVSGIVISVGLYVIFFAGAFTLYVEPIREWEKASEHDTGEESHAVAVDYNRVMQSLAAQNIDLYGRDLYMGEEQSNEIKLYLYGPADTLATGETATYKQLTINTSTYEITDTKSSAFSFGDLMYGLHFYDQLGDFGYYLSGVVSLFFLFAIVTGVVVHWKKIVKNFFVFRPREKFKTVWTDAHTVLGLIGVPFQFMYALTGAMFGLGIVVALAGSLFYSGDKEKYYEALYDDHEEIKLGARADIASFDYNAFRDKTVHYWPGFEGKYFGVLKLGSTTQQFRAYGHTDVRKGFFNDGEIVLDMTTGREIHAHNPFDRAYEDYVWGPVYRLHFANFYTLSTLSDLGFRTAYFVLALITCFVIITGVLIWLEARNKKSVPEKERRYNERVGHIYLAICLGMFPVTALSFLVSKLIPAAWAEHREVIINSVFFGGWLLVSVYYSLRKDNFITNRQTLLAGGVLGLCVPLLNGLYSGAWIWETFRRGEYGIVLIDVLWIAMSVGALYAVWRIKRPAQKEVHTRAGAETGAEKSVEKVRVPQVTMDN